MSTSTSEGAISRKPSYAVPLRTETGTLRSDKMRTPYATLQQLRGVGDDLEEARNIPGLPGAVGDIRRRMA
jgi:hypothetical protein